MDNQHTYTHTECKYKDMHDKCEDSGRYASHYNLNQLLKCEQNIHNNILQQMNNEVQNHKQLQNQFYDQ
jgi:hypothetical protein